MIRVCGCITERTPERCIKAAKKAVKAGADIAELRMDGMKRIEGLEGIFSSIPVPVIATNRSMANGGKFKGSEKERVKCLLKAIKAGCDFVDVEVDTDERLKGGVIQLARKMKCRIIASAHDFKGTPNKSALMGLMRKERKIGDIGKIVTLPKTIDDCHRILGVLLEAKRVGFPMIAFGMGKIGIFTRIIAPFYGSYLTYCSVNKPAGPGQLSIESIRRIYREIGMRT